MAIGRRKRRASLPTNPGFTILEVLLVAAILGILAGAVLPNGSAMLQAYRLRAAAEMVAADLRLVQERAVAGEGSNWRLVFNYGGDRHLYLIKRLPETGGRKILRELPPGVAFGGDVLVGSHGLNEVYFTLDGTPNSGAVPIVVTLVAEGGGQKLYVKVAGATGRVLVSELP